MKKFFVAITFVFTTIIVVAQNQDTIFQSFENDIVQQEMAFENCNNKIVELKALYRVDMSDFEKEDLTDKIWYYELTREVVELKIKFLKKEIDYAKGILERPSYEKETALAAIDNNPKKTDNE